MRRWPIWVGLSVWGWTLAWWWYAVNPLDCIPALFSPSDVVVANCANRAQIFQALWLPGAVIATLLLGLLTRVGVIRWPRWIGRLTGRSLADDAIRTEAAVRKFLLNRQQSEPQIGGTTSEEWRRNTERHTRHFTQTLMLYKQHFASKVQYLADELGKQGYQSEELDHLVQHATNTLTIEAGIQALGALGRKLAADEKRG